jgi:hypothetical protein
MSILTFPIGEFSPDSPDIAIPGATTNLQASQNLFNPYMNGLSPIRDYRVVASQANTNTSVNGLYYNPINARTGKYFFTRSDNKIFSAPLDGSAPTDLTGAVTITQSGGNGFLQWGEDVIFTDGTNLPVVSVGSVAAFVALITSATKPKGAFIGSMNNYVIMACDKPNSKGDYVFWSALNDSTNWDASLTTGAGSQKLVDTPGDITGFVAGEIGLVFKERGIFLMAYTGSPFTFDFSLLSGTYGTRYPRSIIQKGRNTYFFSQDGFRRVVDRTSIEYLGYGKVEGFLRSPNSSYWAKNGIRASAYDYNSGLLNWLFQSPDSNTYYVISYKEETDEWFFFKPAFLTFNMATGPYTDLINYTQSQDVMASVIFQGSAAANGSVSTGTNQIWTQAANLTAGFNFSTKKLQLDPQQSLFVRGVRFISTLSDQALSDPTLTVTISYSNDPYMVSPAMAAAVSSVNGWYSTAIDAQYIRVNVTGGAMTPGAGFQEFNMIQLDVDSAGSMGS